MICSRSATTWAETSVRKPFLRNVYKALQNSQWVTSHSLHFMLLLMQPDVKSTFVLVISHFVLVISDFNPFFI
jgi:hypothetical protein